MNTFTRHCVFAELMVLSNSADASVVLTSYCVPFWPALYVARTTWLYNTFFSSCCLLSWHFSCSQWILNHHDVSESKAVIETEKRIRSVIVRKTRRKLMSGASWSGSSGRRRLPIRRLADLRLCSFTVMCSVSRFQPTINLMLFYVLGRGWKTGN